MYIQACKRLWPTSFELLRCQVESQSMNMPLWLKLMSWPLQLRLLTKIHVQEATPLFITRQADSEILPLPQGVGD